MAKGKKGTGTGKVYPRGSVLWIKWYDANGKLQRDTTKLRVGQEREAKRMLQKIEKSVELQKRTGAKPRGKRNTVTAFANQWLDKRDGRVVSIRNERQRQRDYIDPVIGSMRIDKVTPLDLHELVMHLRTNTELAPRTIRTIWGQVRSMFKSAKIAGIISDDPAVLEAGVLPAKEDKDPEWRNTARFSKAEVVRLMTDQALPFDRRILYALKALTGARHGEVAGLRWRHLDLEAKPLARLLVANSYTRKRTKTGRVREVPVHPFLAAMLREWHATGWREYLKRDPQPDDFITPTRRFTVRDARNSSTRFPRDLDALGMRVRRGHDLRRTFISMGQDDGAPRDVLEAITHKGNQSTMSGYTTFTWQTLCAAVSCIQLPDPPGFDTALTQPGGGGGDGGDIVELFGSENSIPAGIESARSAALVAHQGAKRAESVSIPRTRAHAGASECVDCAQLQRAANAVIAVVDAGGDPGAVIDLLRAALAAHAGARRTG